jgi:hypothetical protein
LPVLTASPALDRARPADAAPGSMIAEDTEAEILLQDGSWAWAQVIGQRQDRRGRWCVGLRWYASPGRVASTGAAGGSSHRGMLGAG